MREASCVVGRELFGYGVAFAPDWRESQTLWLTLCSSVVVFSC